MITVRLSGGLGNQLFQYAVAVFLNPSAEPMRIEYQSKTSKSHDERELVILNFNIPDNNSIVPCGQYNREHWFKHKLTNIIRKVFSPLIKDDNCSQQSELLFKICNGLGYCIQDKHTYFYPQKKDALFINGMWHSSIYADKNKSLLQDYYHVKKELLSDNVLNTINEIRQENSVCVHVRRGDYTTASGFTTCSLKYYENAVKTLESYFSNLKFYVFSDDIAWCKSNLIIKNACFIDGNNKDYEDFELMRNCKHFIISNSTFSWWAAYLSSNVDKRVITPKTWFDGTDKSWLNLPEWIQIDR